MILKDIFSINNGEIISVVGAGGKTSFINYFIKNYRNTHKVLSTTTTKIYKPDFNQYDNIIMTEGNYNNKSIKNYNEVKTGVTVIGKFINSDNKIIGLDFSEIENIEDEFDFIFVESDGSRKKKLKGWKKHEPVIYKKTHKVVGIVDITSLDMEINEDNIHNLKEFIKIANAVESNKVNINHLKNMILNKDGLFKDSIGKKILFINKVENESYEDLAKKLINLIKEETNDIDIYYGSIIKEYCKVG